MRWESNQRKRLAPSIGHDTSFLKSPTSSNKKSAFVRCRPTPMSATGGLRRRIGSIDGSRRFLPLFYLSAIIHLNVVAGEDTTQNAVDEDGFVEDDWILVVLMSMLFAFCIALFGSVLGYISIIDDSFMKRYHEEGEVIEGDVVATEFARGSASGADLFMGKKEVLEYSCFIEYNQFLSENYRIRVRKQVRARETDFVYPHHPDLSHLTIPETTAPPTTPTANMKVYPESQKNGLVIVNQEAFFQRLLEDHRKIKLLVLKGYTKSGFPLLQVERARTLRYRFSTWGFVASNIMLAAFCMRMAAYTINDQEDEKQRRIGWGLFWLFVSTICLQIPVIHCLLNKPIMAALEDEYFETAELMPTGRDDSSLSSGSDMCLNGGRYGDMSMTLSGV